MGMRGRQQQRPSTRATRNDLCDENAFDGNGHGRGAWDGWSAHVRYFMAQYPLETRDIVAQVRCETFFCCCWCGYPWCRRCWRSRF